MVNYFIKHPKNPYKTTSISWKVTLVVTFLKPERWNVLVGTNFNSFLMISPVKPLIETGRFHRLSAWHIFSTCIVSVFPTQVTVVGRVDFCLKKYCPLSTLIPPSLCHLPHKKNKLYNCNRKNTRNQNKNLTSNLPVLVRLFLREFALTLRCDLPTFVGEFGHEPRRQQRTWRTASDSSGSFLLSDWSLGRVDLFFVFLVGVFWFCANLVT